MANGKLKVTAGVPVTFGGISVDEWETTPTPPAAGTTATSLRVNVIALPAGATVAEIETQPANEGAYAYIRSDGLIALDLLSMKGTPPATVTIGLNVTTPATGSEDLVVPVTQGLMVNGWGDGKHYVLPLDGNGRFTPEIGDNHYKCYVSTSGITKSDIATAHSLGGGEGDVTQNWLRDNVAHASLGGDGSLYYGETEALAVVEDVAQDRWKGITKDNPSSHWLLLKRGETYDTWAGSRQDGARGESPLHPIVMKAYGTGARPIVRCGSQASWYSSLIQEIDFQPAAGSTGGGVGFTECDYFALDGYNSNIEIDIVGGGGGSLSGRWMYYVTDRHSEIINVSKDSTGVTQWGKRAHKISGSYTNRVFNLLRENCFNDVCGWGLGFDYYGDGTLPQAPSRYNHTHYMDAGTGATIRKSTVGRGSLTGAQNRHGFFVDSCVYTMNNLNMQVGAGPVAESSGDPAADGQQGDYSLVSDTLVVGAGQKQTSIDTGLARGQGVKVKCDKGSLRNSAIMDAGLGGQNIGDASPGLGADSVASGGAGYWGTEDVAFALEAQGTGTILFDDTVIHDWLGSAEANPDSVDAGVLDGTTMEAYATSWQGGTPTREQLMEFMWAEDEPWSAGNDMRVWFLDRLGRVPTARTTGQTVTFRQASDGDTPANRFDVRWDWDTEDFPGTATGDSIDLHAARINSSITPDNDIVNLGLGIAGSFTQFGGVLTLTGNVTGTGNLVTEGSGQIYMGGGTIAPDLTISGGRFVNTGAITDTGDVTIGYNGQLLLGVDGASFVLGTGNTFTINGGRCEVGFDGTTAASSSLTFNSSSTLVINSAVDVLCDLDDRHVKHFKLGSAVTFAGGGAGTIVGLERYALDDYVLFLEGISGTFSGAVSGPALYFDKNRITDVATGAIGTVLGTPNFTLGSISTFRSGMNGLTEPDETTTINCAGDITIDCTGMAGSTTYTILSADTINGTFNAPTYVNCSNITYNATTVTVDVA